MRKNIGAYVAAMGGVDVLAFTGDIGETSATVRSLACQGLGYMGIKLDEEKNRNLGKMGDWAIISADDSPVTILVIANDDERLVAWETLRAIERNALIMAVREDPAEASIPIEISPTTCTCPRPTWTSSSAPATSSPRARAVPAGPVRLRREGASGRPLGPHRQRPRARPDPQGNPGRDRHDRAVQGRHPAADPRIRRPGQHPGDHPRRPFGSTTIERGVICAQRHIHMTPEDAMLPCATSTSCACASRASAS